MTAHSLVTVSVYSKDTCEDQLVFVMVLKVNLH